MRNMMSVWLVLSVFASCFDDSLKYRNVANGDKSDDENVDSYRRRD